MPHLSSRRLFQADIMVPEASGLEEARPFKACR